MFDNMRVLGIDPGTRVLGWCVVDGDGADAVLVELGIERVGARRAENGLEKIFRAVENLLVRFSPDVVAVESPFYGTNAKTLIRLGEARGAILLAAALSKVPVESITPAAAKLALTGNGNATKQQVAYMVHQILNISGEFPPDATDAAAVAIAYLHQRSL